MKPNTHNNIPDGLRLALSSYPDAEETFRLGLAARATIREYHHHREHRRAPLYDSMARDGMRKLARIARAMGLFGKDEQALALKRQELDAMHTELHARGGRDVDLAERIDALTAELGED